MRSTTRQLVMAGIAALVLVGAMAVPAQAPALPARYTLAIGDSIPYGLVLSAPGTGARFTSFVDLVAQRIAAIRPGHVRINYSCPGATSQSIIDQDPPFCRGADQYSPYTGSQLVAAVRFLQTHPDQVSPILVDGGANDLGNGDDLDQMQRNMTTILRTLRQAAPSADIVLVGYGDPYSLGKPDQAARYRAHDAFQDRLRAVAAGQNVPFVDPHPIFNSPPDDQDAAICRYTRQCQKDEHPTPEGHQVYAQLIWDALGYANVPFAELPPERVVDPPATTTPTTTTKTPTTSTTAARKGLRYGRFRVAPDRRSLRVWMACGAATKGRCRVRLVASQKTRRLGSVKVSLRPGRSATVRLRFTRRAPAGKVTVQALRAS